jgi:hypothetical protein
MQLPNIIIPAALSDANAFGPSGWNQPAAPERERESKPAFIMRRSPVALRAVCVREITHISSAESERELYLIYLRIFGQIERAACHSNCNRRQQCSAQFLVNSIAF